MRTPAARAKTPENCVIKTVWVHIRKRVDVVLVRVGPRRVGPRPGSRAAPVRALKLLSYIFDFVLSEHINMRLRLVTADEPEAARAAS